MQFAVQTYIEFSNYTPCNDKKVKTTRIFIKNRASHVFVTRPNSHSHAAGCAQRGEDCRDDACKNLQECLDAFFLHNAFRFKD